MFSISFLLTCIVPSCNHPCNAGSPPDYLAAKPKAKLTLFYLKI